MPKSVLIRLAVAAMTLLTICPVVFTQNCKLSGTKAWNEEIRNVVSGCEVEFTSPNGSLHLKVAPDGKMAVDSENIHWIGPRLEPPTMVSWSPRSNAFFLNDGEGSGLSSSFRLFRILGGEVSEDKRIEDAAVTLFRERVHCASTSADPNVWGFGWNSNGDEIYLLIQPTVNDSCGRPDQFISSVARVSDGKILEIFSKAQTRARFGARLPLSLFGK